jgi:hypothetical protein
MHQKGCASPAGTGDPELARISELRDAMALSPEELSAKLKSDSDAVGLADPAAEGAARGHLPRSFAAVPALANLASIVTSLQADPPPPPPVRAEAEVVLPGDRPPVPPLAPASEASPTRRGDEPVGSLSVKHAAASEEQSGWVRQRVYAAGLGLIIGLTLMASGLLWLAGQVGSSHKSEVRKAAPTGEEPANFGEGARWSAVAKPELAPQGDLTPPAPGEASGVLDRPAIAATLRAASEPLVQEARQRIERGDVAGARDLLANADTDPSGVVLFTLAETYDPNMLAAWGIRGISPDSEKAKGLYSAALSLGFAAARQRLDALQ